MQTYLHERVDGALVEYRRVPNPVVLLLEARELQPDGRPYDERWFRVSDLELLNLQLCGSDIVSLLAEEE